MSAYFILLISWSFKDKPLLLLTCRWLTYDIVYYIIIIRYYKMILSYWQYQTRANKILSTISQGSINTCPYRFSTQTDLIWKKLIKKHSKDLKTIKNNCCMTFWHCLREFHLAFLSIGDRWLIPVQRMDHSCMHWDSLWDNLKTELFHENSMALEHEATYTFFCSCCKCYFIFSCRPFILSGRKTLMSAQGQPVHECRTRLKSHASVKKGLWWWFPSHAYCVDRQPQLPREAYRVGCELRNSSGQ